MVRVSGHVQVNGSNDQQFLSSLLDSLPSPLFVVDADVRILAFNAPAAAMLGENATVAITKRGGEALHCINATVSDGGCGGGEACKTCVVRNSVTETCLKGLVVRRPQRMRLVGPEGERDIYLLVTTSLLPGTDPPRATLMFEDIGELVSLQGLVPVYIHCRRVHDESRGWHPMERYLKEHLDLDVSHGLCPDCLKKHYPELTGERPAGNQGP